MLYGIKATLMPTKIFVNLPVKDLDKTIEFFTALGYRFDPRVTDENATCMIVDENIYVMLLVEKFFGQFTRKKIADAHETTEAIICLSAESKNAVNEIIEKAVKAGATTPMPPQDHGWMYQHGFQDPNGHLWEFAYMDEAALAAQSAQQSETK